MEFACCAKNDNEEKELEKAHEFLKVLADKNRLKILCILRKGPKCVCEIFPIVGISQKLASHHLGQMKKLGLLEEEREGNFIRYGRNEKAIGRYAKILKKIIN
ncbi:MAG TPA: ArsR family transcriptional regulator [Candidatus Moranbacteria bacterium]|nr:MAG: Transcriptional regulator, ArsR family [Candidatus Moranbacteria bacterium GW2011_GWC2_45_10]KKT95044.1 MAG: Transcriptional regulator, ArsR family [Parcubacteria group bacterium GW2011_GWC1_45_14]HAV11506.1 ArsR family transcriptional regulator [Candidatus Moranbacteria bacterium]